MDRLREWTREVAATGQPVVAVSHKAAIRALLALATGWDMTGKPPMRLDWRSVAETERRQRLQSLIDMDRARGLTLSEAPVMRLTLMRVDEHESDGGRQRGREQEVHERADPDASHLADVADPRDAERDGREDERDHGHEEHPQEHLPDRPRDVVAEPAHPRRPRGERIRRDAARGAEHEAQDDLAVELHRAASDATCSLLWR